MTTKKEFKEVFTYLFFPLYFVAVLWLVKVGEIVFDIHLGTWGILPRTLTGLKGIIFSPLIHGDFDHLFSNSIPIFLLILGVLYFYRSIAYRIFFLAYIFSGFGTWLIGRESYHIGASGLVYALASFIFFSGVIRWDSRLIAVSLLVVFLYGSLVWGLLPLKAEISWEGHIAGGVAGFILTLLYRNKGPQRIIYDWEHEKEEAEITHELAEEPKEESNHPNLPNYTIHYIYRENQPEKTQS